MGSCAAPSAKGDDKFITTDYLQQCLRESQGDGNVYASFSAPELLPFLKYYATLLLGNMARRRAPAVNVLDL